MRRPKLTPNWAGQFDSFDDWVNSASRRIGEAECPLNRAGRRQEAVCVDSLGRRCDIGADFHRARDEKTFPVHYFWDCVRTRG